LAAPGVFTAFEILMNGLFAHVARDSSPGIPREIIYALRLLVYIDIERSGFLETDKAHHHCVFWLLLSLLIIIYEAGYRQFMRAGGRACELNCDEMCLGSFI
jgi:hypothetical protein